MFEKPTDQLAGLKIEMLDKTTYCTQRRVILLDDTAKSLKEGKRTSISYPCNFLLTDSRKLGIQRRFAVERKGGDVRYPDVFTSCGISPRGAFARKCFPGGYFSGATAKKRIYYSNS